MHSCKDCANPVCWALTSPLPTKGAVIPFLDEMDDWATAAGAVNTIVSRDRRLTGHNTDGVGFLRALRDEAGFSPEGRRALVLGAGGSARAVVLALSRSNVASLTIANRTHQQGSNPGRTGSRERCPGVSDGFRPG